MILFDRSSYQSLFLHFIWIGLASLPVLLVAQPSNQYDKGAQMLIDSTHKPLPLNVDSFWNSFQFPPPISSIAELKTANDAAKELSELEKRIAREWEFLEYRNEGLKFWNMFPSDKRKFIWLETTITRSAFSPHYYEDVNFGAKHFQSGNSFSDNYIKIDTASFNEWQRIYPKLRAEYLKSPAVSRERKEFFKAAEFSRYLITMRTKQFRNGNKLNLEMVTEMFLDVTSFMFKNKSNLRIISSRANVDPIILANQIFTFKDMYELTVEDLVKFVQEVKHRTTQDTILDWVKGKELYLSGFDKPWDYTFKLADGRDLSLQVLRGKVVLLDFWATWCGSCIALMPKLKKLYEKYRDNGFEVISISLDSYENLKNVMKLEKRIGADWPLTLIGGKSRGDNRESIRNSIFGKMKLTCIPQIFVLKKDGTLYGDWMIFVDDSFEEKLQLLLRE